MKYLLLLANLFGICLLQKWENTTTIYRISKRIIDTSLYYDGWENLFHITIQEERERFPDATRYTLAYRQVNKNGVLTIKQDLVDVERQGYFPLNGGIGGIKNELLVLYDVIPGPNQHRTLLQSFDNGKSWKRTDLPGRLFAEKLTHLNFISNKDTGRLWFISHYDGGNGRCYITHLCRPPGSIVFLNETIIKHEYTTKEGMGSAITYQNNQAVLHVFYGERSAMKLYHCRSNNNGITFNKSVIANQTLKEMDVAYDPIVSNKTLFVSLKRIILYTIDNGDSWKTLIDLGDRVKAHSICFGKDNTGKDGRLFIFSVKNGDNSVQFSYLNLADKQLKLLQSPIPKIGTDMKPHLYCDNVLNRVTIVLPVEEGFRRLINITTAFNDFN